MSHLGELLSAYVDGELDGAEQDKAAAHLARCEQCRAEACALRGLKRQLGALAETPGEVDITQRMLPFPVSKTAVSGIRRPRILPRPSRGPGGTSGPTRLRGARQLGRARQLGIVKQFGKARHPRRYLVLGTVSIVMGIGTAAFTVGGGDPAPPGPRIVPQVELYSEEHAITTGGIPFDGPTTATTLVTSGAARHP
jgi:hypothetical protein